MIGIRWCCAFFLAFNAASQTSVAKANDLELRDWLDRPGVKLLAVEFYATWCKPCMEAVPRWRKLHEAHRKDGLRLVVVATQDPEGGCTNPGWNPDEIVCDDEGTLAQAMLATQLPAAFLWSWQGNLLVRNGHVDEVESGIQNWIDDLPRVDVTVSKISPGAGVTLAELRELVRGELGRSAKLTLVATKEEREQLKRVLKESFNPRYDQRARCEVGKELPPNSILQASIFGSNRKLRLRLGLLSLERGCLITSSLVRWDSTNPEVSVAEAASKLFRKLRPTIQMPGGKVFRRKSNISPGSNAVTVGFDSEPSGATVFVDEKLVCQSAEESCRPKISRGSHTLTMYLKGYASRSEKVNIDRGTTIRWILKRTSATLAIRSQPSKLQTMVDGRLAGRTPISNLSLSSGYHTIRIADPCYESEEQQVELRAAAFHGVDLATSPVMTAVDIELRSDNGKKQFGDSFVDGQRIGKVPGVYTVPLCSKLLEVRTNNRVIYRSELSFKKGVLNKISVVLSEGVDSPTKVRFVDRKTDGLGEIPSPGFERADGSGLLNKSVRGPQKKARGQVVFLRSEQFTDFQEGNRESEASNIWTTLQGLGYEPSGVELASMSQVYKNRRWIRGLIIPEMESGKVSDIRKSLGRARKFIYSYVAKGGTLIMSLATPKFSGSMHFLRDVFGWKNLKSQGSVGKGLLISDIAQSLRISALPEVLENNGDTDVVVRDSLPRGARILYADEAGHAMVSVLPLRRGRVVLLGWDWYDALPTGTNDGGWTEVLDAMLR
ncbi:MAG: PEGA domain-containing protein [Myxococcales bacterium]|nr:PEGA domain-containing protein [Myxococcales bacterium]